ncbi:MAG: tetratricopeptide repeat-containing sensor histidine kinase [Flavitalea sp.]
MVLPFISFEASYAQTTPSIPALDSIIKRVPVLMRRDENKARQIIDTLSLQSTANNYKHGIIQSLFFKAWLSYRHDPADVAIQKIDSALQHVKGIKSDTALVNFYILKGQCFVKKTQIGPAIEQFQQALKIAEERKDYQSKTSILISIGWAYMEDGKSKDAIRFFEEVLRLNPSESYASRPLLLCNIAACYNATADYKQAEKYAIQGIAAARRMMNNSDLANGLNILGRSYQQQGLISKAITCLKEAAIVREKVADPSMLASDYLQLADLYMINKRPALALQWAKKAEAISTQQGNELKLAGVYQSLSAIYTETGDFKRASIYLRKEISHRDRLERDQYNRELAQMRVQFETQKKTAENLQLKKENLEAKLKNSDQQKWMVLLGTGIILLIASGIYASKLMKSRYRTRLAMAKLNEQKQRTIAIMEAEEKERRRIAGDLHDGVGQMLAAASIQLEKAKKGLLPLDKVDEMIRSAGVEVRNISHQVTPELLLHHGLVKALELEVDRLNDAQDQTSFSLYTHIELPLNDEMLSLTLYRCFQELCVNILKHAKATEVNIHLNLHSEEIQLMLEDNGVGFEPGKQYDGLGIRNMKSRVALYEGVLLVDSMPGKGTTSMIKIERPLTGEVSPNYKSSEQYKSIAG